MTTLTAQTPWIPYPPQKEDKPRDDLTSVAFLPFAGCTFSCISRVLSLHSIRTVDLPSRKVFSFLQPVKDAPGLKTTGISSVNVARCTLGTPSRPGSESTSDLTIQLNQPWQSKALIWVTASTLMEPVSWQRNWMHGTHY
jgi:hypothetical protein